MKLYPAALFILFLSVFLVKPVYSQLIVLNPSIISGKMIDHEVSKGISFVHILNESLHISALSDTTGRFTIRARPGDTIVFSVIGYLGKYIVLNETSFETELEIFLSPRYYEIAELEVFAFSSYSRFIQKFQDLKLPKTETDILRDNLQQISQEIGKEAKYYLAMKKAAEGGNLMAAPILSPEEIQRIKLKEMIKNEKIQTEIDKKYNRQIVADLTGLRDLELDEFMLFCKFDQKFLQFSSQYEILVKVLAKYEAFKELKKKSSIQTFDNYAINTIATGHSKCQSQY